MLLSKSPKGLIAVIKPLSHRRCKIVEMFDILECSITDLLVHTTSSLACGPLSHAPILP